MKDYNLIHSEDIKNIKKNGYVVLPKISIEYKERLRNEIDEGLSKYNDNEIRNMKDNLKNSKSWHGLGRHKLYEKVGMQDCYRDYKDACKIVHIAEENPFGVSEHAEFVSKTMAYRASKYMIEHMIDFRTLCPNTFSSLKVINELEKIKNSLSKSHHDEIRKHAPSILELKRVT